MTTEVQLPDGTVAEFPDSMSDQDIHSAITQHFAGQQGAASAAPAPQGASPVPASAPSPQPQPMDGASGASGGRQDAPPPIPESTGHAIMRGLLHPGAHTASPTIDAMFAPVDTVSHGFVQAFGAPGSLAQRDPSYVANQQENPNLSAFETNFGRSLPALAALGATGGMSGAALPATLAPKAAASLAALGNAGFVGAETAAVGAHADHTPLPRALVDIGMGGAGGAASGAIGEMLGGASGQIYKGLVKGKNYISDLWSNFNPTPEVAAARAASMAAKGASADLAAQPGQASTPLAAAMANLKAFQSAGKNPMLAQVVGGSMGAPNTWGQLRAAGSLPGPMKATIERSLREDIASEPYRLGSDLQQTIGAPAQGFNVAADALAKQKQDAAKPLFQTAFQAPPTPITPALQTFFDTPTAKIGFKNARRIAADDLNPNPTTGALEPTQISDPYNGGYITDSTGKITNLAVDPTTGQFVPTIDFQTLHYMKMGMDKAYKSLAAKPGGSIAASKVAKQIGQFVDHITSLNPDLGKAYQQFSGDSATEAALQAGNNLYKGTTDNLARSMAGIAPSDVPTFQTGAGNAVLQKIQGPNDGRNLVTNIAGSPEDRQRLAMAFGTNTKGFDDFTQRLALEDQMHRGAQAGLASIGSQTNPNMIASQEMADKISPLATAANITGAAATGNYLGAARQALGAIASHIKKPNAQLPNALANLLMQRNVTPEMLDNLLSPKTPMPIIAPKTGLAGAMALQGAAQYGGGYPSQPQQQ